MANARGNPQNLRPAWKPGESGNPRGPERLPEDLKRVQRLSPLLVELAITKLLAHNTADFEAILADPATSMLDRMIATVIARGVIHGEPKYLEFILSRTIGRMKDVGADDGQGDAIDVVATALSEVPKEALVAYLRDRQKAPG